MVKMQVIVVQIPKQLEAFLLNSVMHITTFQWSSYPELFLKYFK
jgi:hypothetical protein